MKKISFEEANDIILSDPGCILLDVREEEEYITGHAIDALLYPVDDIESVSAARLLPDKNANILVYCRSGRRSREACIKLEQLGYTSLYDIGSLIGWPYGTEI